jgi:hypothetical protein
MAELPEASVTIDDEAGALAGGTDLLTVFGCVEQNDDLTPRIFASTKALLAKHGYSPAVDYCAIHFEEAQKPVLFVALPTVTAGTIGRVNTGGNSGSSSVSVSAGSNGVLEEVDGEATVVQGGTIGTDQIILDLSLDGGRTTKRIRLGTDTSYPIPYVGQTLTFGAGDLTAGDVIITWSSTAPRWDQSGLADARAALVAQQKQCRSWLVVGDLVEEDDASDLLDEVNAYETENARFVYARAQVRDRKPDAALSHVTVRKTGTATLTFAASTHTVTRSAGSWISDGFAVGQVVTITGTTSNNVTKAITVLTDTVMTFAAGLVNEGPTSAGVVVGSAGLVFAASGDTITRSDGSWLADGFAVGDSVTITGTVSNNLTGTITVLTATVMTLGASSLTDETIGTAAVVVAGGELDSDWMASVDDEFGDIDGERRIDLGAGRGRKASPISGYRFRRPVAWAASLREYQHDVQIPTWRKSDGKCVGWDLEDEEGNTVEHDERIDGGALAARFTCFRTYANGPAGAFIALSLTRAAESSLLSRTHNMAVANVACSVTQAETENAIGQVLELNADGTGTEASLVVLEERVNSALAIALLQGKSEGKRASDAKWKASRTDILNIPAAELTGTLDLRLNGTLEKITTRVRVQTAG